MSYFLWFEEHAFKHRRIIEKLTSVGLTRQEIIAYYVFENMVQKEPDFCLLYANKQKCHDRAYLNCYLCACPHFRFNDEGLTQENGIIIKSTCAIHSKKSALFVHEGVGHLDCSQCIIPHTKAFVEKHFDGEWRNCMKECITSPKACEKE